MTDGISRGWIQEEFIHVDVLPAELKLPRRYAFRYMEIEAIDTSLKWQLVVEDVAAPVFPQFASKMWSR